ncbi:hypothetical protein DPSP01_003087 [Paraphaeosphaeria sporulosa]|uniref:Uncharacterized protein n=1 Tax=Paraphaeosphaeria sporulosa TaxID=1460663 RepID=A0A177C4I1_9PLEO|nr:uncharacterized protein CC84DRAFT_1228728 [Paraphaeosphaeria sporulosa]OAG01580.1 hypothetical protein CC84DRAFT_1228728 [Paraphaeosphaeria sporulosa]
MRFRSSSKRYTNLESKTNAHGAKEAWYWRFIALAASWMILCGYLILPGLYAEDPQLRISQPVLNVFVVALLTAGYSFTALLCFACRNELFQAESIFLPALTSSAVGLLTIAYNFLVSKAYVWGTAAISGTVISTASTFLYGMLLLWTHRRIVKLREQRSSRSNLYNEPGYYNNFVQNMYPAAARSPSAPPEIPLSDEDRINQQMALLLMKQDQGTSPDASSATFRIDLPEDHEERDRIANSQELVGTPPVSHADWNRARSQSRPDSLGETQAWERWQDRGRTTDRPASIGARSNHSRAMSREERRREIEMGLGPA